MNKEDIAIKVAHWLSSQRHIRSRTSRHRADWPSILSSGSILAGSTNEHGRTGSILSAKCRRCKID